MCFACTYVYHVSAGALGGQRMASDSLELELQATVGTAMWLLGVEPRSLGRTDWAISIASSASTSWVPGLQVGSTMPVSIVVGTDLRTSDTLGRHSTNQATASALQSFMRKQTKDSC